MTSEDSGGGGFALRLPQFSQHGDADVAAEYSKILSTSTFRLPDLVDEDEEEKSAARTSSSNGDGGSAAATAPAKKELTSGLIFPPIPEPSAEGLVDDIHEPEFSQADSQPPFVHQTHLQPQQQQQQTKPAAPETSVASQAAVPLHLSLSSLEEDKEEEDASEAWTTAVAKTTTTTTTPAATAGKFLVVTTSTMPLECIAPAVPAVVAAETSGFSQLETQPPVVPAAASSQEPGWQFKRPPSPPPTPPLSSPKKRKRPQLDVGFVGSDAVLPPQVDAASAAKKPTTSPKKKKQKKQAKPTTKKKTTTTSRHRRKRQQHVTEDREEEEEEEEESESWITDEEDGGDGSEPWNATEDPEEQHGCHRSEDESEDDVDLGEGSSSEANWPAMPASKTAASRFRGFKFVFTGIPKDTMQRIGACVGRSGVLTAEQLHTHLTCGSAKRKAITAKTVLLAVSPARTIKYLLALALAVPCVRCEWVFACEEAKTLVPFEPFLLSAGTSEETGAEVPIDPATIGVPAYPLDGQRVEVLSEIAPWELVLRAAGAKPVRRLFTQDETRVDYVLVPAGPVSTATAASQRALFAERARRLKIPVVTSDWLIECVVRREHVDPGKLPDQFLLSS